MSLLTPTTQKCNMYIRSKDSLPLQKYLPGKDKNFIATQLCLSRKQVLNTWTNYLQKAINKLKVPLPVPLVTCRLRHGFKTEEPRRRDWRMKRIRVYRFDSQEVSCRKTEGKSMIDEESLVLFCEMFHAWLDTMLSFTDCLSVAASLEEDVISLSFTGQSMISWDSLRETAVAANWPKMIVGDADKQWQALLVGETAWELGFLISEVGGGGLDVLSQPRQLASPHLLLKEIKQSIGKYLHRADPFKYLLCANLVISCDKYGQVVKLRNARTLIT